MTRTRPTNNSLTRGRQKLLFVSILLLAFCNYSIAQDSDQDGVIDSIDLDDDNDGILDVNECTGPNQVTFEFKGTFGVIPVDSTGPCPGQQCFQNNTEDLQSPVAGYGYGDMNGEGRYAKTNNFYGPFLHVSGILWPDSLIGHTTGTADDAYLAVNGSTTQGVFYRETLTVPQNTTFEYGVWFHNANGAGGGAPEIEVVLKDAGDVVVATVTGGPLQPSDPFEWVEVKEPFNSGSGTTFTIEVRNVSTTAGGNDFAIDDVFFREVLPPLCDTDDDSIPNETDLDSDNDNCFDVIEAGHDDPDGDGILGTSPVTVDADGLVLGQGGYSGQQLAVLDSTDTEACCGPPGTSTDTDGDGLCDVIDPDDDNDGVPDGDDSEPLNKFACADTDGDTCDDCSSGTFDPSDDGTDTNGDGFCDAGCIESLCDDGDPLTENDIEFLAPDSTVCIPCAGTPLNCEGLIISLDIAPVVFWENTPVDLSSVLDISYSNGDPVTGTGIFNLLDSEGEILIAGASEIPFNLPIGGTYTLEYQYTETDAGSGSVTCTDSASVTFKLMSNDCE
ncbi:MAG: hypothetical protein HKN79_11335 [Flavobacteriales bacterium]|nr:hypothetical protein [Flavobacteriales bacterium]